MSTDRRRRNGGARRKYSAVKKLRAKSLYIIRNPNRFNLKGKLRLTRSVKKSGGPFLQICKGKRVLEPSNNNTKDQLDDDQARTIHFQDEIIMDILSRLCVQSLLQSKCVSKFWYSLISDPYFKMMHLKRAKNDKNSQKFLVNLMSHDCEFSCYYCPLSPVHMGEDVHKLDRPLSSKRFFRIQCTCDGLVIVMVSDTVDDVHPILLLWNPCTNESLELPSPELQGEISLFGMGYDSTSSDYKILIISSGEDECALPSAVLALKGGSWRKIDKHPHVICNNLYHMNTLAFVHETFHWIGMSRNYSLVSLSSSDEVYGEVPLSEQILCSLGNNFGVAVLDEMLCVYSSSRHRGITTFKTWVMKDYGVKESWSLLLNMKDPSTSMPIPKYRFANGEVLFLCYHIPSGGHAFRTRNGAFVYWSRGDTQDGFAFTESLISPKSLVSSLPA